MIGLAAIAVRVFFLDHGRIIARFVLPDDRGAITVTIAIAVMIAGFADGDAGSDRPDATPTSSANAGAAIGTDDGGNKQIFLHVHPPES